MPTPSIHQSKNDEEPFMNITRKTLATYWHANMRYPHLFIGASMSWLGGMILQKLAMALIAAHVLNKLIVAHGQHTTDYWPIFLPYLLAFIVVAIAGQLLIDLGLLLLSKLETRVRPELQNQAFDWLVNQSLNFHANTFSGALVNKVSKFTTSYNTLTDNFVLVIMRMTTNVVVATAIIAYYSATIALVMFAWTIVFAILNVVLTRRRIKYSKLAAQADTVLTAHLADSIGNISAVKAFGNETAEAKSHSEKAHFRAARKYKSWMEGLKNDATLGILMSTLQFGVLVLSIQAIMNNVITIGILLLIQVYVTQLITELWGLSNLSRTIEQAVTDGEEMVELFEEKSMVIDPSKPQKVNINKGAITFQDVDFTHDGSPRPLFKDFDLQIKPGEKIGLVGHSGSGKTTLTRILLRFSDIDGGEITIDGQNIASIKQADLRKHIAYVPQEPILFHRSLRENIAYGNPRATLEEVRKAAHQAYATEFIDQLPDSYETLVGERGVKLSGGQRQRIAIARAMLKDAPIIVLDEATSALDSESEKLIQAALNKLMRGRTTIVIAHRLSTIQKMDRIIVMENGRIVEQGSHAELLAQKGAYAKLWQHQSGGFIEE
jgi:ATP-binding cassette subfamily B protein